MVLIKHHGESSSMKQHPLISKASKYLTTLFLMLAIAPIIADTTSEKTIKQQMKEAENEYYSLNQYYKYSYK